MNGKWMKGVSVAIVAAAIGATPAAAQGLKIGALLPLTGGLQAYGEANLNGVRLAEKLINEAGGVNGAPIEVIVADTQTNPQAGVDAAQKLVNVENVDAIVGPMSSGVTIPVATSVTSREGVVTISPSATAPTITTVDDNGYLFRTAPSDAFQGVALAKLVESKGTKKVAIIFVNNDYGQGLADAFKGAFSGEVTASLPYEPGAASYRGELQKAAEGNPEALLLIGYPENGVVILRQALEGGFFDKFIFTDGMKAPEIIEQIGAKYLDAAYGTSTMSVESKQLTDFRAAYEKEYGQVPPLPYIDASFDAMVLLALSAAKAGKNDRAAIRDALVEVASPPGEVVGPGDIKKALEMAAAGKDINYEGAAGSEDFDANGDVPGVIGEWTMAGGKINDVGVIPVE